jgi:benzoyl-CoA reductase/2-hydroxyglutaryl-CoA dehydratase subunit BcrC/BadD/HgdB
MSGGERTKNLLLGRPSPRTVSLGSLLTMAGTALMPAGRYPTRSQKKLALAGYYHGWKFFGAPRRAVFTSLFSPIELVYAFGLRPFPVEPFGALAASFSMAPEVLARAEQRWVTSDYCTFHRAFIGTAHLGLLPSPRFLLATSHVCDGTFKSFSEVNELYGKPFFFINTPFTRDEDALRYLTGQIRQTAGEIESLTGRKLSMRRLERAFLWANRLRDALGQVEELRKVHPPLMYGEEAMQFILLWSMLSGSRAGAVVAESYRDELLRRVERMADSGAEAVPAKKRILWLHLKPFYDSRLMQILEKDLGAVVVAEEINTLSSRRLDTEKPWESLARRILEQSWLGGVENRIENILDIVREWRIDGVVHFSHWGCRQSNAAVRMIRDAVNDEGVPFLDLDGDCVDPRSHSEEQYRTRLESFAEIL